MTVTTLALVALLSLFAAFVQGFCGFGYGLVLTGLTALFIDLRDAALINGVGALLINAVLLARLHRAVDWKRILPAIVAVAVAAPFGVQVLRIVPIRWLHVLMATIMLAAVWQRVRRRGESRPWDPVLAGIPCGLVSGSLTGALGMGGPPAVAYLSTQASGRLAYAAGIQVFLGVGGLIRLATLFGQGVLVGEPLTMALVAMPGAVAGSLAGLSVLHRISDRTLIRIVQIMLVFLILRHGYLAWIG